MCHLIIITNPIVLSGVTVFIRGPGHRGVRRPSQHHALTDSEMAVRV